MVEGGWEAASGYVSFMSNGDPVASYDFCHFEDGGNDTYYEACYQTWTQSEPEGTDSGDGDESEECWYCTWTPNDPMFDDQWHLMNTGQSNGTQGEDANLPAAWGWFGSYGYFSGSGVVISIIDDGLDWEHPDLSPHFSMNLSWDWCYDVNDPTPWDDNAHGTSAAGVAAAAGNNSMYGIGAAYEATLAGHLLIACSFSDAMSAGALSAHNHSIDIYSNSWGLPTTGRPYPDPDH